jgi:very-short-patch-repair endonuclease
MALRKITGLIGSQRILVVFTNQLRMNMDAKAFGDKYCVCPFTTKIKIKYKKPDRVKKISIAAKRMWKNAKNNNLDLVHRMLNSSKNKNYDLNGYKMNAPEYQIGLILNDLKLNWKYESVFNFKKCCYLPDFSIDSLKLIVECYGDFWHANPKYFKPTDTTHKNRTALQVWEYDEKKKETFESNGYKYFYFWESDIMECPNEIKKEIKKEIYENIRRRNFNNWLENKAIEAENYPTIGNEHRYPTDDNYNQTWAKYFRSLKNIHLQNTFIIGGFDITNSPLLKYLDYHINEYNVLHETGSITYSKK